MPIPRARPQIAKDHIWEVTPLCEGGFGDIFVVGHPAFKPEENRLLIMKIVPIPSDKDSMWVPRMEFEALKRIQHCPHANHYLLEQPEAEDLGTDNMWWSSAHAKITMLFTYYPRNLNEVRMTEKDLVREPAHLKNIIYDVVNGLDYLHKLGIIHKDIKPENIFLNKDGLCKIGDLGAAFVYTSRGNQHSFDGAVFTTNDCGIRSYNYSAPEIIIPIEEKDNKGYSQWSYDESVDFWSLGMCIYDMIVGEPLPWCEYRPDTADKIIIDPDQIPHIMRHVLASHSCDPEILDFIQRGCCPNPLFRLRREAAVEIVSAWDAFEDPDKNRFTTTRPVERPKAPPKYSLPPSMLGKENLAQIGENTRIARQFEHMLKTSRVVIPEHSDYRYTLVT